MTALRFTKMEGAGNDYVHVDAIEAPLPFPLDHASAVARRLADRHFGVGGDGLIVMTRGERAPLRMLMWNADGSRGAMCGNGLRCLARLGFERGHVRTREFDVETDSGPRSCSILASGDVRTAMGQVRCGDPRDVEVADTLVRLVPGDAGNPHAVVFVDDVEGAPVERVGAALQKHGAFPDGVNVEFVQVASRDRLLQRTFERGSGETLACGSGAVVAVEAARRHRSVDAQVVAVQLRGGTLLVCRTESGLAIEGPARTVFRGEIESPGLFR